MTATMPTDAQARVLLSVLVTGEPCPPNLRSVMSYDCCYYRGWITKRGPLALSSAGRDALARWLLRDFDPKKQPRLTAGAVQRSMGMWLRTREHHESYATWLLRGLR